MSDREREVEHQRLVCEVERAAARFSERPWDGRLLLDLRFAEGELRRFYVGLGSRLAHVAHVAHVTHVAGLRSAAEEES